MTSGINFNDANIHSLLTKSKNSFIINLNIFFNETIIDNNQFHYDDKNIMTFKNCTLEGQIDHFSFVLKSSNFFGIQEFYFKDLKLDLSDAMFQLDSVQIVSIDTLYITGISNNKNNMLPLFRILNA